MVTTKDFLHEIADPSRNLPEVYLDLASRDYDTNTYAVYALSERIGQIKLGSIDKGEPFVVQNSHIDERLRGRGYGLAMYLGAAALAYDSGHRLTSDILVSRDAAALWLRLQNRGLARIWEPFQWKNMEQYSHKGRAKFVPASHLEALRPIETKSLSDEIWEGA